MTRLGRSMAHSARPVGLRPNMLAQAGAGPNTLREGTPTVVRVELLDERQVAELLHNLAVCETPDPEHACREGGNAHRCAR